MSFLKRYKTVIGLTAVFALAAGGAHLAGMSGCGGNCPISSILGSSTAYAGPGCAASKAEGSSCTGKTEATNASAKTCSKEDCILKLMKEKGMAREQAEAAYASGCAAHTNATAASATSSGCAAHANMTTAAVATSGSDKTCAGGKEACIAKCMAEKGMTRAEAEACYAKCQAAKADGKSCQGGGVSMVQAAVATDGKPVHSREACIDACVAKGMSKAEAAACADKCGAAGFHNAAATQTGDSKEGCAAMKASSSSCATAAKAGCCSKAKGSASTTATTTTTTAAEAPAGGTK